MEENVYMVMHGHHGNEGKGDEEKQDTYGKHAHDHAHTHTLTDANF